MIRLQMVGMQETKKFDLGPINNCCTYLPADCYLQLGRITMYTIAGITIKVGAALDRALNVGLHTVPRKLWD